MRIRIKGYGQTLKNNKILMLVNQNGPSEAKGVFDLTNSLHRNPFMVVKRYPFDPAYRRGSPSGNEGLGSWIKGAGEEFPSGFGQRPRFVLSMLNMDRQSRQASQTPIYFDAKSSKYV